MRIIEEKEEFHIAGETAVSIGKFDGVHIGHGKLLNEIIRKKEEGLLSCVFTFDPPPDVFFGFRKEKELSTKKEKRILFEQLGVDILVEFPMNQKSAAMPPEEFVRRILKEQLHAKFVAAGTDLSFGKDGKGNSGLLCDMQDECGFKVKIIDKVLWDGREVSSTFVRECIERGDMVLAENLLGDAYPVYGEIIHGHELGREIGIPTINQIPPENKLLPPFGVYFSEVEIQGRRYKGITNIGCKPTVNQKHSVGVETFIYNFNQDVYGDMAQVRLFQFHRPEQKFPSVQALKEQMKRDIKTGFYFNHKK